MKTVIRVYFLLVQFLANQNLQSYINLKNFFWKKKPSLLKLKWSARLHVSWNSLYIQPTVNKNVQTSNTVKSLKKIHSWIYHWLCVQSFQNGTEKPEKRQSKANPITVHSYSTFFQNLKASYEKMYIFYLQVSKQFPCSLPRSFPYSIQKVLEAELNLLNFLPYEGTIIKFNVPMRA